MTTIARRATGPVADPLRSPGYAPPPPAQPYDDLMREKVRLVRTVAEGVLAAPEDRRLDEAQDALLVAQEMERQAERLRSELRRTLKPWAEDATGTSLYRNNAFQRSIAEFNLGAPLDPRTRTAKVFRRYAVGSEHVFFEVRGWPEDPNTGLKARWEFSHRFGSYLHSDLTTVQAMSDLMCRQHGYMMTDDPSEGVAGEGGGVTSIAVRPPNPPAPQIAVVPGRAEDPKPEPADQDQPVEMIWDPVFG